MVERSLLEDRGWGGLKRKKKKVGKDNPGEKVLPHTPLSRFLGFQEARHDERIKEMN